MGSARQKRVEVNRMGDENRDEAKKKKRMKKKGARKSKIRGMAPWRDKGGGRGRGEGKVRSMY